LAATTGIYIKPNMHLGLKIATDILRPWERLNSELVKQNSIDSNISEFITVAGDLAVKLSHFPEVAGRKSLRTDRQSKDFNIIVDVADSIKHAVLKKGRANTLYVSSLFEGDNEGGFRFIRNQIAIDHEKYGKSDFLEISRNVVQFLLRKLNINILWNPTISEGPEFFRNEVSLDVFFSHQIAWTGLRIEFFKRDQKGDLVHFDPPSWLFSLQSPLSISASSYFDYIGQLLRKSIPPASNLSTKVSLPILEQPSHGPFVADFLTTNTIHSNKTNTIFQVLADRSLDKKDIQEWHDIANKTKVDRIILITKSLPPKEVCEYVSISFNNVYLISIDKYDAYSIPLGFFNINYIHNNRRITALHKATFGVKKEDEALFDDLKGKPLSSLGKVFSRDKINSMSFSDLCLSFIKHKNDITTGRKVLKYSPKGKIEIYIKINDSFTAIGIEADFEWAMEIKDLRMPILHYNKSELGISIWNLQTHFQNSNGIVELKIQVTKYGDTSAIGML